MNDRQTTLGAAPASDPARSLVDWLSLPSDAGVEADAALAGLRSSMFRRSSTPPAVGRYRDLCELGRGGMGVVYRAWDTVLSRVVALKLLRVDRGLDSDRLKREAQAMAQVGHRNVVEVFDFGDHDGEAYVAMEYVRGQDLDGWRTAERRSIAQVLEIFVAAGRGLAAAHAHGLVHRDFKPSNVLVGDDGRVRVADFGLCRVRSPTTARSARARDDREHGSSPNASSPNASSPNGSSPDESGGDSSRRCSVAGTPRYMAPEQHEGREVDARADQWSFAASLRESLVLTGTRTVDGREHGRIDSPLDGPLPPLPRAIRRALERALSTSPRDRFASMDALLAALTLRPRSWRWSAAAGGLVATALFVGAASTREPAAPSPCDLGPASLEAVWSETRRQQLQSGGAAAHDPGAAVAAAAAVDAWASPWIDTYADSCRWTWRQPDARPPERARICLRAQLTELGGLLDAASSQTPKTAARGLAALSSLPSPNACTEDRTAGADLPLAVFEAHVEAMARVNGLERAGRHAEAAAAAEAALKEAGDHAWPAAWAELRRGRNLMHAGDFEAALAPLEAAFFAANELNDADVSLQAAIARLELAGWRSDTEEIDRWLRHAQTWRARWPDAPPRLILALHIARADKAMRTGELDDARHQLELAWDACDRREDNRYAVHVLSRRGQVEAMAGDLDGAADFMEDARRSTVAALGPDHPEMVIALNNLAMVEAARDRLGHAAQLYADALTRQRAAFGDEHPHTAQLMMNLGVTQLERGDAEAALTSLAGAARLHQTHRGDAFSGTADALDNLSAAQIRTGAFADAKASARRGREIYEAVLGAEHAKVGLALVHEAEATLGEGDAATALALGRRGRTVLLLTHPPDHAWVASADEVLEAIDARHS